MKGKGIGIKRQVCDEHQYNTKVVSGMNNVERGKVEFRNRNQEGAKSGPQKGGKERKNTKGEKRRGEAGQNSRY